MVESNVKILAKNTFFLYFRMFLVLLVTLYTSRVILKVLGFEDFGIYNLVGGIVVFLSFFKNALTNATYRYLAYSIGSNNQDELKRVYSMAINSHVLLAIILWIIMELVGVWFLNNHVDIPSDKIDSAKWVFQFSLLTFCVGVIQTPFHSNIVAHERMSFYAIVSMIEVVLKLLVVYLLILSPINKLVTYSILLFIVSLLVFGMYVFFCRMTFKDTQYISYWDKKWVFKFASYSGWSLFVNASDVCTQQSFNVFFNWFVGVVGNAALGLSNQVSSGVNMFVANFSQAFNPQIIKSYAANNRDYFMKLIFSMSKISYILFFVIAVPVVCNIEFVLSIWLGEYPELTPSLIKVTLFYYLFDSFQIPLWQGVHATGNIKIHQIIVGSIKLLSIPLAYIIFKYNGSPVWAMFSWAIMNGICSIVRTVYVHFLYGLNLEKYLKDVCIKLFMMSVVILILSHYLTIILPSDVTGFILSTILLVLATSVLSIILVFDKCERKFLKYIPVIGKYISKF